MKKEQCWCLHHLQKRNGYDGYICGIMCKKDELDCITIKNSKWPKKYYEHYTSDHVFIDVDAPFM